MNIQKQFITITPDGKIEKKEITEAPEGEEINKAVGGYFELVPYFTNYDGMPCIAFCNEYGKINKLPFNSTATNAWEDVAPVNGQDHLVGTVVIITGPQSFLRSM